MHIRVWTWENCFESFLFIYYKRIFNADYVTNFYDQKSQKNWTREVIKNSEVQSEILTLLEY